jgi:1-acyl-sn-glycerol-3-phosphate acyltransferase
MGLAIGRYAVEGLSIKVRKRERWQRLRALTENVSSHCRVGTRLLGFDVHVFGRDPGLLSQQSVLFVGNHVSYTDILVLSSVQSCVFVTSVDMGESFGLGHLAEIGGSLFIERRNRSQIGRDVSSIADALREGFHVALYPEGTSTDGRGVLPFKRSLFQAAIETDRPIVPVCIKYTHINGEPFGDHNRDLICWYGDMDFLGHFKRLVSLKSVRVELHFLPEFRASEKGEAAERAHRAIRDCYAEPPRDI